MRIARLLLLCSSILGGNLFAQEATPASSASPSPIPAPAAADPIPATPPATITVPEPVLLPESAPVDPAARDAAFKEVGEQPPSDANPPPPAQGAPPVGGEDVIPLPDGTAIPPEENQMPSQPSTTSDEQLVLPGEVPVMEAPAISAGPTQSGPSNRELQVRYVKLRTEVDKDPKVRSLKLQAETAKTDEDKRQALRAYYRLLFQKIRKADPGLTEASDVREAAYLRRLEQNRIEPTIPLNPPPTPEPLP